MADNFSYSATHILVLEQQHDTFIKEAFTYLLDYFGIQAKTQDEFRIFTDTMGRAIVTISYVYRRRLRSLFRNAQIDTSNFNEFVKIAKMFDAVPDGCYFFRILLRISSIFELAIHFLKEGYDYIEAACQVATYREFVAFFDRNGGFYRLNETASFIAEVGEILQPVMQEKPQNVILKSFVNSVQNLENRLLNIFLMGILYLLKKDLIVKSKNIHKVDPRFIKVFYSLLSHPTSELYMMNESNVYQPGCTEGRLDIEYEKKALVITFRKVIEAMLGKVFYENGTIHEVIDLAQYFAAVRHLTDLVSDETLMDEINTGFVNESGDCSGNNDTKLNVFFILEYRILDAVKANYANFFQEVHPFDNENTLFVNLRKLLDSNIVGNNYFKLNDGKYVVYTPLCTFDHRTAMVMSTGQ